MIMEQERIKMPTGALVACILVVLLLLAAVGGIGTWIYRNSTGARQANAGSDAPVVTTEAPSGGNDAPVLTPQPAITNPDDHTDNPSSVLDQDNSGSIGTDTSSDIDIIADCMESVVSIDISMSSSYTGENVYAGSGSGVIITDDGYIVTCNHVIEGASAIKVYLNDGSERDATLIGADSVTDIAVVKIEGTGYAHAKLGSSASLRAGSRVYAIGNALGELSNTVTEGIISGVDREIEIENQRMTVLQTSAAINSGNSGGALFLNNGDLIGIVNAKSSGTTSSGATIEGLAFAVPIDTAKPIIADLMDYGFVTGRPYLGVYTQDSSYSMGWFNTLTYPVVMSVIEGSAAEAAGIQVNDIITKIDGKDINGSSALRATINTYNIGDTITVTVQRGNQAFDIQVTLLERTAP